MILTKEFNKYLKENVDGYVKAYSITESGDNYRVDYIKVTQENKRPIKYNSGTTYLNLKQFKRDFVISDVLESLFKINDFNVEEIIYTPEQRDRLEKLRKENKDISVNYHKEIERLKIDYSESFSVGQKVWYKGCAGIITFKHFTKKEKCWNWSDRQYMEVTGISRFSVKVKNIEYRYVYGTSLLDRVPEKINIDIDKELDKLSTERLLALYKAKRKRNRGQGDIKIKAILNQREHIQKGETIIK